jgi:hypothetical protein
MTLHATGTFAVTIDSQSPYDPFDGASLGRVSLNKQFSGDLEGTSRVEMLSAISTVKGSAGYVAIERVTGTLHGKRGTFILQHTGTMTRGTQDLSVTVVPDTGTGELTGIAGRLAIDIIEKIHHYAFEYTLSLPDA